MTDDFDVPVVPTPKSARFGWRVLWIGSALLVLGPVGGFVGTVAGIWESSYVIDNMRAPTPADVGAGVRLGMTAMTIGLLIGLLGLVFVIEGAIFIARARGAALEDPS